MFGVNWSFKLDVYLVDTLDFWNVGDGVRSVFVFFGFNFSLECKTSKQWKVNSKITC